MKYVYYNSANNKWLGNFNEVLTNEIPFDWPVGIEYDYTEYTDEVFEVWEDKLSSVTGPFEIQVINGVLTIVQIVINLAEAKTERISLLKGNSTNKIYEIYPIYKQIDITGRINGYTDNDFHDMDGYITSIINQCNSIELTINNCNTVEEVENIDITII